jgi:hypothetical protein
MQKEEFINMFEYFYKQTINSKYKYGSSPKDETLIDKFLLKVPIIWGNERMFDFLCFQFSSVSTWETKETVQLSWVIGDKAFDRWYSRTDEQLFMINKWKLEKKLINKWIEKVEHSLSIDYKEFMRNKNSNSSLGLFECLDLRLYSVVSKICVTCQYNDICLDKHEARKESL